MRAIQLDKRSSDILRCVVDFYLETGEPIGSESVSKRYGVALSSATIRNVMAELEEAGLLFSMHTSSGRAPTSLGINIFLEELKEPDVSPVADGDGLDGLIISLSQTTKSIAVLLTNKRELSIECVEMKKISMGRWVCVIILNDGETLSHILYDICDEKAYSIKQRLNTICKHKTVLDLKNLELDEYDNIEKNIIDKLVNTYVARNDVRHFVVKGQVNLFEDIASLEQFNAIKKIIDIANNEEVISPILAQVTSSQVINCNDFGVAGICGCSVAATPCYQKGNVIGVVGIVGFMKRNYKKIVPLIEQTATRIAKFI